MPALRDSEKTTGVLEEAGSGVERSESVGFGMGRQAPERAGIENDIVVALTVVKD